MKVDLRLLTNLSAVLKRYPHLDPDAFSAGQIESKLWLLDKMSRYIPYPGTVYILGGWYGVLGLLMLESEEFKDFPDHPFKVRSFDIDEECTEIADMLNKHPWVIENWKFKASTADAYKLDYENPSFTTKRYDGSEATLYDRPRTVINTICEHMDHFNEWYSMVPGDKYLVLQSNNFYDAPDHVNCVNSLEEFKTQLPNLDIYYQGERKLAKYTRYMIIGKKLPFQKKAGLISATSTFQKVVLS